MKRYIIDKTEEDTVVTDNLTGVRCRVIKNDFAKRILDMAKSKVDPWEMMQYGVGRIRKAYVEGDLEWGSLAFSQVCGLIRGSPILSGADRIHCFRCRRDNEIHGAEGPAFLRNWILGEPFSLGRFSLPSFPRDHFLLKSLSDFQFFSPGLYFFVKD